MSTVRATRGRPVRAWIGARYEAIIQTQTLLRWEQYSLFRSGARLRAQLLANWGDGWLLTARLPASSRIPVLSCMKVAVFTNIVYINFLWSEILICTQRARQGARELNGRREPNQRNWRTPPSLMHLTTELWLFNIGFDIKPPQLSG